MPDLRPYHPAASILRRVGGLANRRSRNSSNITSQMAPIVSSPTKSASVSGPIGCPAPAVVEPDLEGVVGCGHAPHHLEQLHHLGRVEEVQAHEAIGPAGAGGLV